MTGFVDTHSHMIPSGDDGVESVDEAVGLVAEAGHRGTAVQYATPHAMVLVHKPGLVEHDFEHLPGCVFPIKPLPEFIAAHEQIAALVAPSRVVAIALNTSLIDDESQARREIERTARETGLPCDDPVRFGPERLWAEIQSRVEAIVA